MPDRRGLLPALALWGLVMALPAQSHAIYGDSDGAFGLDGSLRTFVFGLYKPDLDFTTDDDDDRVDGLSNLLFRLVAAGRPTDSLKYELHAVSSSVLNAASGGGGGVSLFGARGGDSLRLRYRLVDEQYALSEEPDLSSQLGVDRLNVSLYLPFADVVIGRQAISFGKAFLWNPLDVFRPFDPTSFDRDYKTGVDALTMEFPVGDESSLVLVGSVSHEDALADNGLWYGASALARFGTTVGGWDVALQGGKVYGGYQGGGAVSGELGPLAVRVEGAHFEPQGADPFAAHQSVVAGVGHTFESGLQVEVEYFYNGGADALKSDTLAATLEGASAALIAEASSDPEAFCAKVADQVPEGIDCLTLVSDPATLTLLTAGVTEAVNELDEEQSRRLAGFMRGVLDGRLYHVSTHLAGLVIRHEFMPLLNGTLAGIFSLSDGSLTLQPGLVYSAADEVDVVAGALLSFGDQPEGEPAI